MALETELKLTLDPASRREISRLPIVRAHVRGRASRRRLYTVYYDTPELDLFRHRCVLRLRKESGTWIQAVKTSGERNGGLHRRGEFEEKVPGPQVDASQLDRLPFANGGLASRLRPQFETDFVRTAWQLGFPDGTEAELAVDHGEVRAEGASQPICEVELELRRGVPDRLFEVALAISERLDVRIEHVSKADRGFALIHPRPVEPVRAETVPLEKGAETEESFAAILWSCFEQIRANEEPVLHTEDIEAVHQMRVGLRRLRSCLGAFRSAVSREVRPPFLDRLRHLSGLLGACRDWDVFVEGHLERMRRHVDERHPAAVLAETAAAQRKAAYDALRPFIRSRPYNRLLIELAGFIALRQWRPALDTEALARMQAPIEATAKRILARNHKRVMRRADQVAARNLPVLHHLRIACKEQRYAVEFFEAILPRKSARRYRNALRDLQDVLGYLNDNVVADALLGPLDLPPEAAGAKPFVSGWAVRGQADHLDKELPAAWAAFAEQKRFWRKLS